MRKKLTTANKLLKEFGEENFYCVTVRHNHIEIQGDYDDDLFCKLYDNGFSNYKRKNSHIMVYHELNKTNMSKGIDISFILVE